VPETVTQQMDRIRARRAAEEAAAKAKAEAEANAEAEAARLAEEESGFFDNFLGGFFGRGEALEEGIEGPADPDNQSTDSSQ
jgi:membrane protein involved in colicin uptake